MQSCYFRFWLRLIPPVAHQWHRIIKTVSINDIDQCNSLLQPHKYVPSVYPFSSASSVSSVFSASPVSLLSLPFPLSLLSLLFELKSKIAPHNGTTLNSYVSRTILSCSSLLPMPNWLVMLLTVRMEENHRQIDYEQEYEMAILESYYDEDDEQYSSWFPSSQDPQGPPAPRP